MVLPVDKRINLTSSHTLGLTNEGDYSVVDIDISIDTIQKPILYDEETGKYTYPEIGDEIEVQPFPLPFGYSMGIHSLCKLQSMVLFSTFKCRFKC